MIKVTTKPIKTLAIAMLSKVLLPGFTVKIIDESHAERSVAEAFIDEQFSAHHGACITSYHPNLMTLFDKSGDICAIVGYRFAEKESLYLESYFDGSIETQIDLRSQYPVKRQQLVEIGNLAAVTSGTCRKLIQFLSAYFLIQAYPWVVFTGTKKIRASFKNLDIELIEIAEATVDKVKGGSDVWGNYYEKEPLVVAGYIPGAIKKITLMTFKKQIGQLKPKPKNASSLPLTQSLKTS